MNNSRFPFQDEPLSSSRVAYDFPALVRQSVVRAFVWMALGLAITGLTALFVADSNLLDFLFENQGLFWGLCIGELALVWILSRNIMKLSIPVATGGFVLYSLLSGVTLSPIFIVYTGESIASTFFITAATFGAMAAFGYFTKRDLSKMGSYLYMALIADHRYLGEPLPQERYAHVDHQLRRCAHLRRYHGLRYADDQVSGSRIYR